MKELITVSKILDNTYSHPSSSGTYSINHGLQGNMLEIRYSTIVHFASESSLQQQTTRLREQSAQLIDEVMANLKSDFREAEGVALKVKDLGGRDDLELISATSNSPGKVSYYKNKRVFELAV